MAAKDDEVVVPNWPIDGSSTTLNVKEGDGYIGYTAVLEVYSRKDTVDAAHGLSVWFRQSSPGAFVDLWVYDTNVFSYHVDGITTLCTLLRELEPLIALLRDADDPPAPGPTP